MQNNSSSNLREFRNKSSFSYNPNNYFNMQYLNHSLMKVMTASKIASKNDLKNEI